MLILLCKQRGCSKRLEWSFSGRRNEKLMDWNWETWFCQKNCGWFLSHVFSSKLNCRSRWKKENASQKSACRWGHCARIKERKCRLESQHRRYSESLLAWALAVNFINVFLMVFCTFSYLITLFGEAALLIYLSGLSFAKQFFYILFLLRITIIPVQRMAWGDQERDHQLNRMSHQVLVYLHPSSRLKKPTRDPDRMLVSRNLFVKKLWDLQWSRDS